MLFCMLTICLKLFHADRRNALFIAGAYPSYYFSIGRQIYYAFLNKRMLSNHTKDMEELRMKLWIIILGLFVLMGCSKDKSVESEGVYTSAKGEVTSAKITLNGDKITSLELDETTNGTSKKSLGDAYDMTQASAIGKNWSEQVAFLENYIIKNGTEQIRLNDEGKAENEDIRVGCTISIESYLKAIQDAKTKADNQSQ